MSVVLNYLVWVAYVQPVVHALAPCEHNTLGKMTQDKQAGRGRSMLRPAATI